jgi:hypothetical protein
MPSGQPANPPTAAIMSWIKENPNRHQQWKTQAQRCRAQATAAAAGNQAKSPEERANDQLAHMLSTELVTELPKTTPEVYKVMVLDALKGVDWAQVAGDILGT